MTPMHLGSACSDDHDDHDKRKTRNSAPSRSLTIFYQYKPYNVTHTHTGQNISLLMNVTKTRKWSHVKSSVCQHAEGCMAQEIAA